LSLEEDESSWTYINISNIRDDFFIISAKIAGAESGDLYAIRMQNAALIRYHAMCAKSNFCFLATLMKEKNPSLTLVPEAIEEFKTLFKEWIKLIVPSNAIEDEWGLFNPPGINFRELDHYNRMDENDYLEDLDKFMKDDDL
jgi:hypothetical protein